ncbi:MAG TPA: acyl-CoA dehydrogenase [Acidimicrobiia bacterium]|nr:acyl-CoA dehydrogenase [Acidimicrobiia bacterium]
MDFSLTQDQQLLRDTATKLVERECPPAVVRAHIDDAAAYGPLWGHLREFTALGAGPAADLCLFLEQTGYAAAPGPFLAGALYTSLTGGDGEQTGTVAFVDDAMNPFVLEADRVEHLAIIAPGPTCAVVETRQVADRLRFVGTVDFSRRLFQFDGADLDLPFEAVDAERFDAWRDRAYVSIAAEMTGTARRIFEMSLAYAKERVQFDRPIGSFQAIQHKLADMSLALQRATAAVQYAAMTCDAAAGDRTLACHSAKAAAGEATRRILKDGAQIHGGIGYTWEHDLHLYLRRATADEDLLGTTSWHLDRVADLLFDVA